MTWWLWLIVGFIGGLASGAVAAFVGTLIYVGKGMFG